MTLTAYKKSSVDVIFFNNNFKILKNLCNEAIKYERLQNENLTKIYTFDNGNWTVS